MAHHPSAAAAEPEIPVVPVAAAAAGPENRYAVAAAVSDSSAASAEAEAAQWAAGMYIAELASAAPAGAILRRVGKRITALPPTSAPAAPTFCSFASAFLCRSDGSGHTSTSLRACAWSQGSAARLMSGRDTFAAPPKSSRTWVLNGLGAWQ